MPIILVSENLNKASVACLYTSLNGKYWCSSISTISNVGAQLHLKGTKLPIGSWKVILSFMS